jgi:trehalose 6-phosphate synthase
VNPYAVDESARALVRALSMTDAEQTTRMRQMRKVVREFDTHWWAGQILHDVTHAKGSGHAYIRPAAAVDLPA